MRRIGKGLAILLAIMTILVLTSGCQSNGGQTKNSDENSSSRLIPIEVDPNAKVGGRDDPYLSDAENDFLHSLSSDAKTEFWKLETTKERRKYLQEWKEVLELEGEVDDLEADLDALEAKLALKGVPEETVDEILLSVYAAVGYNDKYIGDANVVFNPNPHIWVLVSVTYGKVTVEIWKAVPAGGGEAHGEGSNTEFDVTVIYADSFKCLGQELTWKVSAAYYFLYPRSDGINMADFKAEISAPEMLPFGITPSASLEYMPVFGGPDSGVEFMAGLSKGFDLGAGFTFSSALHWVNDSGTFGEKAGNSGKGVGGLSWVFGSFDAGATWESFFEIKKREGRDSHNGRFCLSFGWSF